MLFAALRFALVAIPAVFFIKPPKIHWGYVVGVGFFLSALPVLPAVRRAWTRACRRGWRRVVVQLQPVFTIGLAVVLLGERPRPAQLAGGALALGGIAIIAAGRASAVPIGRSR